MDRLLIFLLCLCISDFLSAQIPPPNNFATSSWLSNGGSIRQTGNQIVGGNLSSAPAKKWEYRTRGGSESEPLIADLDNDGIAEIIVACDRPGDTVYALNGHDGSVKWFFSDEAIANNEGVEATPVLGDVDGDMILDVAFTKSNGFVYMLDGATGNLKWQSITLGGGFDKKPPLICDIEGDGTLELVCANTSGDLYVIDASLGTVLQTISIYNKIESGFAIADVNNDCYLDITFQFSTLDNSGIAMIDGSNYSLLWEQYFGSQKVSASTPAIADIDNNDTLDVVVGTFSNSVNAYKALNGNFIWSFTGSTNSYNGSPAIADIDLDGNPDVVIGCTDAYAYAINGVDGSLKWDYQLDATASVFSGSPKVGDFDPASSGLEAIISTSYETATNSVYMISSSGALIWSYYEPNHTTEGVSVGDVDGDGCVEIVVNPDFMEGTSSVYVLDDVNNSSGCGERIIPPSSNLEIEINADSFSFCGNSCLDFSANGSNINKWEWHFEGAMPDFSDQQNPNNICYEEPGNHQIKLVYETDCDVDSIIHESFVAIENCQSRFYIPNIFSPNGDGNNDYFSPVLEGIDLIEFSIYDRMGKLVFLTNALPLIWGGMYKNNIVSSGNYIYTLNGIDHVNAKEIFLNGNVTILK